MLGYIFKRILICIIILFGVSAILYILMRSMPGDYITNSIAENPAITDEMIENLKNLYGLNNNPIEGYINWISKFLSGDLGNSFLYKKPVSEVIASKMWTSLFLSFASFILQIIIAVPLGIISATKQYSKADYSITVFSLLGISIPSFFFAAILQKFLAVDIKLFPISGMITAREDFEGFRLMLDIGWHFCLPIIVLVITGLGGWIRYTRTNMLEILNADYIRTARAKGLSEKVVVYKHAFRNTLVPIVTMLGGVLPSLFSGAIITEGLFGIDGLGYTAFQALKSGDIPFIMGFNIFLSVLTLIGTLISDILYAIVDPRIRLS